MSTDKHRIVPAVVKLQVVTPKTTSSARHRRAELDQVLADHTTEPIARRKQRTRRSSSSNDDTATSSTDNDKNKNDDNGQAKPGQPIVTLSQEETFRSQSPDVELPESKVENVVAPSKAGPVTRDTVGTSTLTSGRSKSIAV